MDFFLQGFAYIPDDENHPGWHIPDMPVDLRIEHDLEQGPLASVQAFPLESGYLYVRAHRLDTQPWVGTLVQRFPFLAPMISYRPDGKWELLSVSLKHKGHEDTRHKVHIFHTMADVAAGYRD